MANEHAYKSFVSLLNLGRKPEAAAALKSFIKSFESDEDRAVWTHQFLTAHSFGERIRHELYAEVIFPALKRGYDRGDAWCLYWLAGTAQNLQAPALCADFNCPSSLALLRRAHAISPGNEDIKRELLSAQIELFAHAAHEWPRGILNGMNGASTEDCEGYLADVAFARSLDPSPEQATFLADFEHRVLTYRGRLQFKA